MGYDWRLVYYHNYHWQQYIPASLPLGDRWKHKVVDRLAFAVLALALPSDTSNRWADVINLLGSPWYIANLIWSRKDYAVRNHAYQNWCPNSDGSYHQKAGVWCFTGASANWVEVISTVRENQGPLPGMIGLTGQYGATGTVTRTGNSYDFSVQYSRILEVEGEFQWGIPPTETTPPVMPPIPGDMTSQTAPCAFSIYANGPTATPTDGIHVMILPDMTEARFMDITGALVMITGGAVVVLTGDLRAWATTVYVTHFPLSLPELTEHFFRLEYYPESLQLDRTLMAEEDGKIAGLSNDRRLHIWHSTEKEQMVKLGIASLIEFSYNTVKAFAQCVVWPKGMGEQEPVPYHHTIVGFDEVEVGSEFLPYDEGQTYLGVDQDVSWSIVKYAVNGKDTSRDYTDPDLGPIPRVLEGSVMEVWRTERFQTPSILSQYWDRFNPTTWALWGNGGLFGTWNREGVDVQFQRFVADAFMEQYSNKGRDPNWTISVGGWDTTTRSQWLHPNVTPGTIVRDMQLDSDFRFSARFNYTYGVAPLYGEFRFGTNAAGSVLVNSAFWVELGNAGIRLRERQGGATVDLFVWAGVAAGEHVLEVVRAGAIIKVWLDGVAIGMGRSIYLACVNPHLAIHSNANAVLQVENVVREEVFKDNYVSMSNIAASSHVQGSITQVLAPILTFSSTNEFYRVYSLEWWEDWVLVNGQSVVVTLGYDMINTLAVAWVFDLASGLVDLTITDSLGPVATVRVPRPDKIGQYRHWTVSIAVHEIGGNIIGVEVSDNKSGKVLAALTIGPYLVMTEALDIAVDSVADGGETAYLAQFEYYHWNEGEPNPEIRFPVFLGKVIRNPITEKDKIIIEARDTRNVLAGRDEYWAGDHLGELNMTDALAGMLEEDGDQFWLWLHTWNLNPLSINANYLGFRRRGATWLEIFGFFSKLRGFHFYCTPEGQFIIDAYARNWVSDTYHNNRLRFPSTLFPGATDEWGLYNNYSSELPANRSGLGWLVGFQTLYDETPGKQVQQSSNWGTSWAQDRSPALGTMLDWEATGASPGVANATGLAQGEAGQFTETWATIGADGTDPTGMLLEMSQSLVERYGGKNKWVEVIMGKSVGWFRPMDKVWVDMATMDPVVMGIIPAPTSWREYVVRSAMHDWRDGTVAYKLARAEHDYEQFGVVADGYGRPFDMGDQMSGLKRDGREGRSQSLI